MNYDILIVGAGLSGATIAEHAARDGAKVLVIEKRDHIGGNVFDYIDETTGIRISKYGPHLWHTNDIEVMNYVQRFGKWQHWEHKVIADISNTYVPVPVNITTVNRLCEQNITNEEEMKSWLDSNVISCNNPLNSEQVALSRVGPQLYETLFKPYTIKQWAKSPSELEPVVLQRIPVRTNFDDRYFSDRYQALPTDGYTSIVAAMLDHPNITVRVNTDWETVKSSISHIPIIVFTGPIDVYFKDSGLPPLEYRSLEFHMFREINKGYYQPNSIVNYMDPTNPYTRCMEYKHLLYQKSDWTIYVKEKSSDHGEPYYPVPTEKNRALYKKYCELATSYSNIHFVGRLANYKYFNMDQAIRNAMDYYNSYIKNK
jgi:UDP-galactopyranose mutase